MNMRFLVETKIKDEPYIVWFCVPRFKWNGKATLVLQVSSFYARESSNSI